MPTFTSSRFKLVGIVAGVTILAGGIAGLLFYDDILASLGIAVTAERKTPTSNQSENSGQEQLAANEEAESDNSGQGSSEAGSGQLQEYYQYALQKINEDRQDFGLEPVKLSENEAAQKHAIDMLETRKLTHWTTDGMKPYMRYSLYGGKGYVAQNAFWQGSASGDPFWDTRAEACKKGLALCGPIDVKAAIARGEYSMMYEDLECCDNGHRENILDRHHTHVSLGIAFDGVDFFMVQNFENQYITWDDYFNYDENLNIVSMKGTIDKSIHLETINIFYDPTPTGQTYTDTLEESSYGLGDLVAVVVEPAPPGYYYGDSEDQILVVAEDWKADADFNSYEIAFSLDSVSNMYGEGVYTILIWGVNEDSESLPLTNVSVFRK